MGNTVFRFYLSVEGLYDVYPLPWTSVSLLFQFFLSTPDTRNKRFDPQVPFLSQQFEVCLTAHLSVAYKGLTNAHTYTRTH